MSQKTPAPIVLCVLDGFGVAGPGSHNAISIARTPTWDSWIADGLHTTLSASGEDVGLPKSQFGNSEVGHLNLGAGRVVYQDTLRITKSIADDSFYDIEAYRDACRHVQKTGGAMHLLGLVSDGGVHSHIDHLEGFVELAKRYEVENLYLHAFLDGRDTPPRSALDYVERVEAMFRDRGRGAVASVSGRYYAMDRDQRWDRTERAYAALVRGEGRTASSFRAAIEAGYAADEDDEFIQPTVLSGTGREPVALIRPGDACLCFNFRPDRVRQITAALALEDAGFERPDRPDNLAYVCLTRYNSAFDLPIAFPPRPVLDTLGDVYSQHGLRQLRLAETEKYAHVTYFFSGGREEPVPGEERELVPSAKVATYDLEPEMRAPQITEALESSLQREKFPLVVMNYANADMVGHTGVLTATVRSIEILDECLASVERIVGEAGGTLVVTADHGNAEQMWDEETRSPHTAHTGNPVPLVIRGGALETERLSTGVLADVAPTVLELAGLPAPEAMRGCSLIPSSPSVAPRKDD